MSKTAAEINFSRNSYKFPRYNANVTENILIVQNVKYVALF